MSPVEELEIQGMGRSAIKGDILEMIYELLNNKNLLKLDISGHQAGDEVAIALGKIFQHNNTLHTILWDNNETGIVGLKALKLGLQRNTSIQHLETPLDDLFLLRTKQDVTQEIIVSLMKDIQKVVTANQKAAVIPTEKPSGRGHIKTSSRKSQKRPKKPAVATAVMDTRRASVIFRSTTSAGVPAVAAPSVPPPDTVAGDTPIAEQPEPEEVEESQQQTQEQPQEQQH